MRKLGPFGLCVVPTQTFANAKLYNPQRIKKEALNGLLSIWLRGMDLNQRPSGYEPDELPSCSTPRQDTLLLYSLKCKKSRVKCLKYKKNDVFLLKSYEYRVYLNPGQLYMNIFI